MIEVDVSSEEVLRGAVAELPRDGVAVVVDCAPFAAALQRLGRRVVLVSETLAEADGLTVVGDLSELEARWGTIGGPQAKVFLPEGDEHQDREQFWRCCEKLQLNYWTATNRARPWVEHTLSNIGTLTRPSLMTLEGAFAGVPAFIVGSGPSLTEALPHAEAMRDTGLVIAVNAAGAALPVAPHVTLNIEAEDTRTLLGDTRDSIRAFAICCPPGVLAHGAGPLSPIYVSNPSGAVERITGRPRLETSISATTTALQLADRLGCSPIVLVGQDCAYPDGRLYAEATGGGVVVGDEAQWGEAHRALPRAYSPLPSKLATIEVPRAGGGTVLSDRNWAILIQYLGHFAGQHGAVVQTALGGAHLDGARTEALGDLLPTLPRHHLETADIVARMSAAGPLATRDKLEEFLATEHAVCDAVFDVAWRMAEALDGAELARLPLPLHLSELTRWALSSSEWLRSWCEPLLNDELRGYWRATEEVSREKEGGAQSRAARRTMQIIADSALGLGRKIRGAKICT